MCSIPYLRSTANLVTFAARSAGLASIWARRDVREQACVGRTLRALVGACVYVVSRWARDARGAGGLRAERTGPASGGHPVHSVAHRDGEYTAHIVDIATHLREDERNGHRVKHAVKIASSPCVCV